MPSVAYSDTDRLDRPEVIISRVWRCAFLVFAKCFVLPKNRTISRSQYLVPKNETPCKARLMHRRMCVSTDRDQQCPHTKIDVNPDALSKNSSKSYAEDCIMM